MNVVVGPFVRDRIWSLICALVLALALTRGEDVRAADAAAPPAPASESAKSPLISVGPGDAVRLQVYGRPELDTTTYVADDGTIPVPLAGRVQVAGLSPADAQQRIAQAFRAGQFLVDPQVTLTLVQSRSQQVSVLGAVRTPGRYPIDSSATVMDALAQAGGITDLGSDVVFLLRPGADGAIEKREVSL
jgi:polysaccharide export outer membrane protein